MTSWAESLSALGGMEYARTDVSPDPGSSTVTVGSSTGAVTGWRRLSWVSGALLQAARIGRTRMLRMLRILGTAVAAALLVENGADSREAEFILKTVPRVSVGNNRERWFYRGNTQVHGFRSY